MPEPRKMKVDLNFDFFMTQFMETPSHKESKSGHMIVIDVDGNITEYQRRKDQPPTLKELQEAVGGYIETAWRNADGSAIAFCDEEGKIKRKPENETATRAIRMEHDTLVGDIVFCYGFEGM
jgi:hypothetical protein